MFSLPLLLYGERVHICLLTSQNKHQTPKHHEFIAHGHLGEKIDLFRILTSTQLLNLSNAGKQDYSLNTEFAISYAFDPPSHQDASILDLKVDIHPRTRNTAPEFIDTSNEVKNAQELPIAGEQFAFLNDHNPFGLRPAKDQLRNDILFVAKPVSKPSVEKLRITFSFKPDPSGEVEYSDTLIIHIARTTYEREPNIYRVILDFGSEATQLAIKRPNSRGLEHVKLVEEMAFSFHKNLYKSREGALDYYQRDPKDQYLFKSRVFVKRKGGSAHINEGPKAAMKSVVDVNTQGQSIHDTKELVSILTSTEIKDLLKHRFLAPNLKLAVLKDFFHENIEFDSAKDNPVKTLNTRCNFMDFMGNESHLHRMVLNKFVHAAFQHIRNKLHPDQRPYIYLTLLVPNVYDQVIITQLLKNLNIDIKENLEKYGFKGCEIQIISESDAAFCGMVNDKKIGNPAVGDNYLVVDGGKGTVDYSIIRIDKRGESDKIKKYISRYRSGMIGAGNVITFAFIETVLAFLLGDSSPRTRQKFMLDHLIPRDPSNLNDILTFLELVEELKARYSQQEKFEKLHPSDIEVREGLGDKNFGQKLNLSLINNRIKNIFKIAKEEDLFQAATIHDEFGWIDQATESVIKGVFADIEKLCNSKKKKPLRFTKILIAGRAFRFTPLENCFKKYFKDLCEVPSDESLIYSDNPKRICLTGAMNKANINFKSSLVGIPFVLDKEEFAYYSSPNGQHIPKTKTKNRLSDSDFIGKVKGFLARTLDWIFENNEDKEHHQFAPTESDAFANIDLPFFLHGSNTIKMGSEVLLNGVSFSNPIEEMHSHDYRLLFDGEDFRARILEKGEIIANPTMGETFRDRSKIDAMLIKTVFPFIEASHFEELELSATQNIPSQDTHAMSEDAAFDTVKEFDTHVPQKDVEPAYFFANGEAAVDEFPQEKTPIDLTTVPFEVEDPMIEEEVLKHVGRNDPPNPPKPDDDTDHILSLG